MRHTLAHVTRILHMRDQSTLVQRLSLCLARNYKEDSEGRPMGSTTLINFSEAFRSVTPADLGDDATCSNCAKRLGRLVTDAQAAKYPIDDPAALEFLCAAYIVLADHKSRSSLTLGTRAWFALYHTFRAYEDVKPLPESVHKVLAVLLRRLSTQWRMPSPKNIGIPLGLWIVECRQTEDRPLDERQIAFYAAIREAAHSMDAETHVAVSEAVE